MILPRGVLLISFSDKEDDVPRHLLGCFLVLASLIPAEAQKSRWEDLDQIHHGAKVQVVEQSLKSTSGKFVRFSHDDLTLEVQGKEVAIQREQVFRVTVSGKNRKRNTLIGLGIGGALGVGVGAAANQVVGDARVIPATGAAWAGLGAAIGAIIPASKTVYRAERPEETALRSPIQRGSDNGR